MGITGVVDEVQPHKTSASAVSSGEAAIRFLPCPFALLTNCALASKVRPQIKIVSIFGRTLNIASICPCACTPVPKMPRELTPDRANTSVATPEAAGVRKEVKADPSKVACGRPVSRSQSK